MIAQFDELYGDLVCDDVPRTQTESPEARDRHSQEGGESSPVADPWDGEKPYAEDGFVARYCR